MASLLSVVSVSKSFGGLRAADDISVSIDPGEIVAVVGPNGAGKTTFINLITGWLKPDSGRIDFAGNNLVRMNPREITLSGLSRSFQISQIFPTLTVLEGLKLAIELRNGGSLNLLKAFGNPDLEHQARELAKNFQLTDDLDRVGGELSQGTKKLLDIAMAMARKPNLLLLDEPTSGVSADEKMDLMKLVVDISWNSGATLLFVEHDMDIVREFSKRVIAFVGGKVVCDDTTENAFKHAYFTAAEQSYQATSILKIT